MSVIDELRQFISDLKEVRDAATSGKISNEIGEILAENVYEDVNNIFETCIDKYYSSYNQIFYTRTYALKKTYKIEKNGCIINWIVGPNLMPETHRVSNEYIYEYMFEKGYHGGAVTGKDHPSPGTPWYRTPPPFPGISVPPYSQWSEYMAKKTMAPADRISMQLQGYQNNKSSILGYGIKDLIDPACDLVLGRYNLFNY